MVYPGPLGLRLLPAVFEMKSVFPRTEENYCPLSSEKDNFRQDDWPPKLGHTKAPVTKTVRHAHTKKENVNFYYYA